jgi:predicted PurR-regulated permease PerM
VLKPISIRTINQFLLFSVLVVFILAKARTLIIPLALAILLALLLVPVANYLEKKGVKRWLSTLLSIFLIVIFIGIVAALVWGQLNAVSAEVPKLQQRMSDMIEQVQISIHDKFGVDPAKQMATIKESSQGIAGKFFALFKMLIMTGTAVIGGLMLTLVYTFLLLFKREVYQIFFLRLMSNEQQEEGRKILADIARVAHHYLRGRLYSIIILTILYSAGLMMVGVKNAILLSAIAALLTIVPYVGSALGGIFPVVMSLVTEESFTPAFAVILVIVFIQAIDNYFIEPYIIGGEVNLSAIATIFIVIAGGLVWGVAGMLLFIPLLGMAKIIFDRVDGLQPLGYVIGDEQQQGNFRRLKKIFQGKKGRK